MVIYLVKYCALSELGNISQVAYRTQVLESSPGFFNRGVTTASFQQSGKIPDSNELLIMLVIIINELLIILVTEDKDQDCFKSLTIRLICR